MLRYASSLLLWFTAAAYAAPPQNQIQLHLSWTESDTSSHMAVTWWSQAAYTPTVQYGTTTAYGSSQTGTSTSLVDEPGVGYIHKVRLGPLQPATTYHYRVGNGVSAWSDDFTFTTAPAAGAESWPIVFAAIGDMGSSTNARTNVTRMVGVAPAFVVHAGDLSYATTSTGWNTWFNVIEPVASGRAYMVGVGNHDDDNGYAWYKRRFAFPAPDGRWYSIHYGRLYVIFLDANTPSNAQQLAFLQSEMTAVAADTQLSWRFAVFHQPAYSSNLTHGSNLTVRANFTPEFERGGIDVVFQGHDHAYERTRPLRYNAQVQPGTNPDYVDPAAPIYLVTGGGGAGLYTGFGSQPWTQVAEATHHFLRVSVDRSRFTSEAIATADGVAFDRFTITKSALVADAGRADAGVASSDAGAPGDAGPVVPLDGGAAAADAGEAADAGVAESDAAGPGVAPAPKGSCGCSATGGTAGGLLLLVVTVTALVRRRRSR